MSRALEIQILVEMVIFCTITFIVGYVKGHKDGVIIGKIQGRRAARLMARSRD